MLGKWEGFSDEDLKSMCQTASQSRKVDVKRKNNEENMKISKQRVTQVRLKMDDSATSSVKEMCNARESPPRTESHATKPDPSVESPNMSTVCLKIKNDVAYEVLDNEIKNKNDSLSEFHCRQKMMEEQNRKKKELLAQALADRKKRTHAEAHRLQKIQEELQRLDNLLSDDVAILRDRIEAASLEYTVAQKRFDRAEKEYVDAKVVLLGKLEKKELLTAHLCTIIEQNELRKAQKLSELMEKLQITATDS